MTSGLMSLAVTASLLLLPLIPASILYLLLTPKRGRGGASQDQARGDYDSGLMEIGRIRMQFSVFGSSATYVVLLLVAFFMHREVQDTQLAQEAAMERQAWLVEIPVALHDPKKAPVPDNGELQQIRVELEPSLTQTWGNKIQFWVVPNNGRFPTARFSLPNSSVRSVDLNDAKLVSRHLALRKLDGIAPAWIQVGDTYSKAATYQQVDTAR